MNDLTDLPTGLHSLPEMLDTLRANPDTASKCGFPPLTLEMHVHCTGGDVFEAIVKNPETGEVVAEESDLTPDEIAFRVAVLQRCQRAAIRRLAKEMADETEAFLANL